MTTEPKPKKDPVNPTTIVEVQDLFSKEPSDLANDPKAIDALVRHYRQRRKDFLAMEEKTSKPLRKKKDKSLDTPMKDL